MAKVRMKKQDKSTADLEEARREGYRAGIQAAAAFATTWDGQITGTVWTLESIILSKFNLIRRMKRKKKPAD